MAEFRVNRVAKAAKRDFDRAAGVPDTKSRRMTNVINYATGSKPTQRLKLSTKKPG